MSTRKLLTNISATVLALGLLFFMRSTFHWVATWRQLNIIEAPCIAVQNLLMPMGFYSLGLELIGFIALLTGYRRSEKLAWWILFIIVICLVMPLDFLDLVLRLHYTPMRFSDLWHGVRLGWSPSVSMLTSSIAFILMVAALLLTVPFVFFQQSRNPNDR
ncbi:MAG TPA: hypothetical protein VFC39_06975 [Acidobacteriaceae bacterium]|nr:hypothetical protein [Acidobacteriaceae bacterium]